MEKMTREQVQAMQFLQGCGGDMREALERLEMAQELFLRACAFGKVEKCEKIKQELLKGGYYA